MKKILVILFAVITITAALCGCDKTANIPDGTYRITAETPDKNGYTDFVVFEFKDGALVSMQADAEAEDGSLKTEDKALAEAMKAITGTYPEKFYQDLVNQYVAAYSVDGVDVVAGATMSSNIFVELMSLAESEALAGRTERFEVIN